MKKRIVAVVLCLAALVVISGCTSILEDDTISVTPHEKPAATTDESAIEANSYDQLKACLLNFIKGRVETGLIRVNSYDGDIISDVTSVCDEMQTTIRTPLMPSPA